MGDSSIPKRILIVDDNDFMRRAVRSVFEYQKDFEICGEAVDGKDAIEKAEQLHPDLIILDLSMPVMNGLEAARILMRTEPTAALILLTLYENSILNSEASAAGIDRVVSKADIIDLVQRAHEIFTGGGRPASNRGS